MYNLQPSLVALKSVNDPGLYFPEISKLSEVSFLSPIPHPDLCAHNVNVYLLLHHNWVAHSTTNTVNYVAHLKNALLWLFLAQVRLMFSNSLCSNALRGEG